MADEATKGLLESTNTGRQDEINKMYDANLASTKSNLEASYNQNLSNMQADREKIGEDYRTQSNQLGADYERNRRNNNMKAASNGLNTGAASQMDLAQSASYQQGRSQLAATKNRQEAEADRGISNLYATYQTDINKAIADSDAQRAAALLDEYKNAYDRNAAAAKQMADLGDFTGYETLFGTQVADTMKGTWSAQNPDIAWQKGYITADDFFKVTGRWPFGYEEPSSGGGGGGGGYGGYGYGGGSGGSSGSSGYTITPSALNAAVSSGASSKAVNNWISGASNSTAARTDYGAMQTSAWRNK